MTQNSKIIVAIDGYSSCGKSTMAKALAKYAGYTYIDTGAMYRAVGYFALETGIIEGEKIDVEGLKLILPNINIEFSSLPDGSQHVLLNNVDVEEYIRSLEVANAASMVSTLGFVRRAMVTQQQAMGKKKGIVMDGRDIGTVVFPEAELKIFLTASAEERANRRFKELQEKGSNENYESVLANVVERDERDTSRKESPLKQADDAILIDNTNMTKNEQIEKLKEIFDSKVQS